MEPKYSILLCNQEITEYQERINTWLKTGIKVLWFGKKTDVTMLKDRFRSFSDAFLLQAYAFDYDNGGIVIDGQDRDGLVDILEEVCPMFNAAQYKVEHCQADKHIIVQASAGTGKTTVMIDRIMYLLHTQPDLHLAEVFMITFTNDAAEQMNQRLQDALMTRYKLTGNQRYLRWVEEQSQMNVSTIHSFAYFMLKEYGIGESFTKNLAIRSFQYERRELIKDVIDGMIDENHKVLDQLGVPFYRANSMVGDFWNGFAKLGISHRDVGRMDWGKPIDVGSEPFQKVMTGILTKLDEDYFDIKRKNEAISVDDIMRDLQEVLQSDVLPKPDITMKYLFIDEFQDSDLSQIMVACLMIKLLNPALFVVGDVKQSIYRFRGATDQAFFVLKRDMQEMQIDSPKEYTLVNNYRTSASVLNRMDQYFKVWGQMDQLQYDKPVIPFNQDPGSMRMIHGKKSSQLDTQAEDQIARIASDSLNELVARVEESGKPVNEKTRVVMLTRSNNELRQLSRILRKNRIPAEIRRDGSFYASDAVRDFYIMVSSFLFSDEPKYIFNYLLTPYAGEIDPININDMEHLHGDYENLISYLDRFLDQTNWKKYHKELRLRPVLAVLKEIQDDDALIDHYIQNSKARRRAQGWEENRCNAATFSDALQYQANLEKLMEILERNLSGDKVSIYDVYKFLKLNIATNREETEAEVVTDKEQSQNLYRTILCMTVHKAKGLEFDTVIIPFTNRTFPTWDQTEIIIDPVGRRVGWNYTGDKERKNRRLKYPAMRNSLYVELKEIDAASSKREETRILYVAMTRAIHNLICIVPDSKNENTWASLIEEVGVDYE
ncbi:UvrD-helicase domain-containing protein [Bacillota bacterium LCP21S3_D9]